MMRMNVLLVVEWPVTLSIGGPRTVGDRRIENRRDEVPPPGLQPPAKVSLVSGRIKAECVFSMKDRAASRHGDWHIT